MFCNRCGVELQPGQRFCGSCGTPVGVEGVPRGTGGRVGRHLQILAILWFAASALNLIGGAIVFVLANTLFARIGRMELPGFLQPLLSVVGGMLLLKALAGFAAGWGLLERQSWARPLALVLGFVSLINIPLGTALGIYTIWVLIPPEAGEEYQRLGQVA